MKRHSCDRTKMVIAVNQLFMYTLWLTVAKSTDRYVVIIYDSVFFAVF